MNNYVIRGELISHLIVRVVIVMVGEMCNELRGARQQAYKEACFDCFHLSPYALVEMLSYVLLL